ncbi:MAG TPA: N-acetylneuraminate synthase family protein [Bacteroidales bacterium]|nr:N-acetylneuraminate synthase family protein [Bacteroidales bacterium]
MSVFIIGEIGINHNGDVSIAKKLIKKAKEADCNAVKFQKRTIEDVYSEEELNKYRESPWGTVNRQQKEGLEFGETEYDEINDYCKQVGIDWFASAWDLKSQIFLKRYNLKYNKVASAMITNRGLLEEVASEGRYTFISTGMTPLEQIDKAVEIFKKHNCPYEIMHCCSEYPLTDLSKVNLKMIPALKARYGVDVGYSGHEVGISVCCAAVAIGATSIERHITLDRSMYGSDQAASLEISGLNMMNRHIREIEKALGKGEKIITEKEKEIAKKLRKVETL